MVTSDGRVKVLDFGLAKLAEPGPAEATATSRPRRVPGARDIRGVYISGRGK